MSSVDQSVTYFNTTKVIEMTTERSFAINEDVAICKAFLSVLDDLRGGSNLQSQTNICNGIYQKFVARAKNQSRSQDSVRYRWEKIMTRCFKFHGYLTRVRCESQKELTESEMAHEAKLLYVEYERQQFVMDHCWKILQDRLFKWQDMADAKNLNTPTKMTDSQEFDQLNLIGQLNKQGKKAEMRKDLLEEKRLALAKKMQEIEEKQVAAKQLERDDAVMSMDTSKMDPQTQIYWAMRKDEIIAKAFNRLDIWG